MIPMPSIAVIGAVVAVMAGAAGGWMARGTVADRQIAELQAQVAQERQRHADAARAAEAKARAVEQRRVEELGRIEHESAKRTQAVQVDAAAARRAADSLRQHIAALAASHQAPSDSAPADSSPSADPAVGVLAVVLRESVERNIKLAEFADAAHGAGLACESAHQALIGDP